MSECPRLPGCPFFNDKMTHMPTTADMVKDKYCREQYLACARYRVAEKLGKENVPKDLYPNDSAGADTLLQA